MNAPDSSDRRRRLSAAFTYFVVAGVATVMLGPVLPALSIGWNVPDSQLGTLFVANFAGQLCGAWFAVRRLSLSLAGGAACTALGCVWFAYSGFTAAHIALFFVGLGIGAGLTAGNVIVGTIDAGRSGGEDKGASRAKLLALLNMCWGVGAIACPILVHASLRITRNTGSSMSVGGTRFFFLLLAIALACSAALSAVLLSRAGGSRAANMQEDARLPARTFAFFFSAMLLYVGVENALGGWLPTYAQRTLSVSAGTDIASSIALCFWLAELSGRAAAAFLVNLIGERLLYRACLGALIVTTAILCLIPHLTTAALFALAAIAGLALAPLFPLTLAFVLARAGKQPRLGPLFASSALGGAILPWMTGVLSTHFNALRVGLAVPATGAVLLLLLSLALPQSSRAYATAPL